jgi:hypothetical protein
MSAGGPMTAGVQSICDGAVDRIDQRPIDARGRKEILGFPGRNVWARIDPMTARSAMTAYEAADK